MAKLRVLAALAILALSTSAQAQMFVTQVNYCSQTCSAACVDVAKEMKRDANQILSNCGVTNTGIPVRTKVFAFSRDNCTSLVGQFDPSTKCGQFLDSTTQVWAVSINGKCLDIQDTTIDIACETTRDLVSADSVEFFGTDDCKKFVAAASSRSRCSDMSRVIGTKPVWSVKINGQCQDIADVDFATACNRFAP
jgi:hypothetical protein